MLRLNPLLNHPDAPLLLSTFFAPYLWRLSWTMLTIIICNSWPLALAQFYQTTFLTWDELQAMALDTTMERRNAVLGRAYPWLVGLERLICWATASAPSRMSIFTSI